MHLEKKQKTEKVYFFVVVVAVVVVVVVAVVFGEYHRTVFSIFQISTNSFRFVSFQQTIILLRRSFMVNNSGFSSSFAATKTVRVRFWAQKTTFFSLTSSSATFGFRDL